MNINIEKYPAKLLLFGEYTVLLGSRALASPFYQFSGYWNTTIKESDARIIDFFDYLSKQKDLKSLFNIPQINEVIKNGIAFDSTIPLGYGLGSSGALCAATYDIFAVQKSENLQELKQIFAHLESYFHGSSSGVDPLICYLQKPVLIDGKGTKMLRELHLPNGNELQFFLLDTARSRKTDPLVKWFVEQTQRNSYREQIESIFIPLVEETISAVLQSEKELLMDLMHEISAFQIRYFQAMIPDTFRSLWLDGLSGDLFKLKLCGAGGGGYFLGITSDFKKLQATIDFKLIAINS